MLRRAVFPKKTPARNKYPATDANASHLEIAVGIQALPNPDRDVDALADQIHRTVGDQELDPEERVFAEERGQCTHQAPLDSDGTTDANEALGLRFFFQRQLRQSFRLGYRWSSQQV